MDIDFQALRRLFLDESEEALTRMEAALLRLEERSDDSEALAEVFRIVHTLKGDAGTVGFTSPAAFAHQLEDLLDLLRRGEAAVTGPLVTLLLRATDALRTTLASAAAGRDKLLRGHEQLLRSLTQEVRGTPQAGAVEQPPDATPAAEPAITGDRQQASTLRVDVDKLDQLLTLVGEIAVARGRHTQLVENQTATHEAILEDHRDSDRLHMDLQELVMKLRMVPVGPTFQRYARTVRDLSKEHGKAARLVAEGREVEVDNSVIQLLRDPLTHMVRNSIDHGLEPAEERVRKGKNATGTVTLRARHAAGSIVIELEDDGAGLDRERILGRARALGKVGTDEEPEERELFRLVFEPGFSTTRRATDLSGRGVGMDVVRRNIEALRGSVDIDSRPDEGTRIVIRLPLTLAIIDGLLVRIVDQTYVVPLDSVVESLDLPDEARANPAGHGVVNVRGRTLPYVRLRELFQVNGAPAPRENVVVVQMEDAEAGLVVDEVFGKAQTVIKPLAKLFQRLPGISGSAILGNGQVALILDVQGLLRREIERGANGAASSART